MTRFTIFPRAREEKTVALFVKQKKEMHRGIILDYPCLVLDLRKKNDRFL